MTCVTDVEGLGDRKWTSLRDCAFGLLLACTQNMGKGRGTGGTGLALAPFRRLSPVTDDCASIRRPIGWGMQGTAAWEPPLPPVPPAFAVPGVPQAAQCPQYPYPPNPPCTPSTHSTPNTHRLPPQAVSIYFSGAVAVLPDKDGKDGEPRLLMQDCDPADMTSGSLTVSQIMANFKGPKVGAGLRVGAGWAWGWVHDTLSNPPPLQ